MKEKLMSLCSAVVVSASVFGPESPSLAYAYAPEMPEEIKELRGEE